MTVIADKVDPLVKNGSGLGLSLLILKSKSARELIRYLQTYFPKQVTEILMSEVRSLPMLTLASQVGNE